MVATVQPIAMLVREMLSHRPHVSVEIVEDGHSAVRRAIAARTQGRLQTEVLVPYLLGARWFADKGRPIARIEFVEQDEWRTPEGQWLMAVIAVHFADGGPSHRYFLPLAIAWDNAVSEEKRHAVLGWALGLPEGDISTLESDEKK